MVGVNVPIRCLWPPSFGGWKRSLFWPRCNMHGPDGVRFYTKRKGDHLALGQPAFVKSRASFQHPDHGSNFPPCSRRGPPAPTKAAPTNCERRAQWERCPARESHL